MYTLRCRQFICLHDDRRVSNVLLLHTNRNHYSTLVCTNTASILLDIKSPIGCAYQHGDLWHNFKLDAAQHDPQEIQPTPSKGIAVASDPSLSYTWVWTRWPNRIIVCAMCNSVFVPELRFPDGATLEAILWSGLKVILVERLESSLALTYNFQLKYN